MKIALAQIKQKSDWLCNEIMHSFAGNEELISQLNKDGYLDVMLVLNGKTVEPIFYNNLISNIEKYIDNEANILLIKRLDETEKALFELQNNIEQVSKELKNKYEIY